MIVKEIQDSILNTDLKNIAHGVNCQGVMRSGVAKVLFTEYPQVKDQYHNFINNISREANNGMGELLGLYHTVNVKDKTIFNLFTQENFGYDGKLYLSYQALESCFSRLNYQLNGQKIAIPKIGCGLAGGDWNKVKNIINSKTKSLDVYVYFLKDN